MVRTIDGTGPRLRLVGYTRVSSAGQVEGESLPAQRKLLKDWAKAAGHRLVAIHEDAGVSGSNGLEDRQGLYDALEAIVVGKADGLLVKNLDRLARKLTVQEAVLTKVWERGAVVFSVEDGGEVLEDDAEDPMRTAMRQLRGVVSQLEKGLIVKRLRDGRQHKAARGGYAYGAPPFGWKAEAGELVPVDAEQEALQVMLAMHADGASTRAIAAALNTAGHSTKRGSVWVSASVARTLANAGRQAAMAVGG